MAFIGKIQTAKAAGKAPVTVTANKGRLGVVIRGGLFTAGDKLDVRVGTEEHYGLLQIVRDENGIECKAFGKKGTSVSWSAIRSASKKLPTLNRHNAVVITNNDELGLIVDLNLNKGE